MDDRREELDIDEEAIKKAKVRYKKRHKTYDDDDDDEEELSLGAKLKKAIFPNGDIKKTGENILLNCVVPFGKDMLVGTVNATLGSLLNTDVSKYTAHMFDSGNERDRTSYSKVGISGRETKRYNVSERRSRFNFERARFDSYESAADCYDALRDFINDYGKVRVRDFFDLADHYDGDDEDYTDTEWGWRRLGSVDIYSIGGFWCIAMPEPVDLRRRV